MALLMLNYSEVTDFIPCQKIRYFDNRCIASDTVDLTGSDSSKNHAYYGMFNNGWYHSNSKFFLLDLNLDIKFHFFFQISTSILRHKKLESPWVLITWPHIKWNLILCLNNTNINLVFYSIKKTLLRKDIRRSWQLNDLYIICNMTKGRCHLLAFPSEPFIMKD